MKKPRSQSPLDSLPLQQKQALAGWLGCGGTRGNGMTYKAARERMLREFGVKTSETALHHFYRRQRRAEGPWVTFDAITQTPTIVIKLNLVSR